MLLEHIIAERRIASQRADYGKMWMEYRGYEITPRLYGDVRVYSCGDGVEEEDLFDLIDELEDDPDELREEVRGDWARETGRSSGPPA
ncbi:hypothetical protein ElP_35470 [Tautonia plasticadhaerens]|uniref:Uncharacterized protein n=2 Tax=Tautonia plasticadhaerens TaxID=2527974 RepID=A0A518H489_9BACT|nr:hypothetical protein ElP_35470 [Tautonia plasticadhaerens]